MTLKLVRKAAATLLAFASCVITIAASAQTPTRQPNIIVIIADDLGYADVSAYAKHARIPTPNIDRLAKRGVRFTNGHSTAPVCSPSRAGLMTGRYQQRFGFEYLTPSARRPEAPTSGLPARERTMAEALRPLGYRTGILGKWHLGTSPQFWPTNRGFDEFFGFLIGEMAHIDSQVPGVHSATIPGMEDRNFRRSADRTLLRARAGDSTLTPVPNDDVYMPEAISTEADGFITRNREKPFFLYVAHHAPHAPLQTTDKYWNRFPRIANRAQRIYAAMVSALDDSIGEIVKSVERNGLNDNTLFILSSDNGCAGYIAQGICDYSMLSGAKLSQFEGGTRVPFILAWPGKVPARQVDPRLVSQLDVFPTALVAAGTTLPSTLPLDGVDLVPYLKTGGRTTAPHEMLFFRLTPHASVIAGDWKLIRDQRHRDMTAAGYGQSSAVTGAPVVLFNLRDDPREEINIAYDNPQKAKDLLVLLEAWEKGTVPPAWPGLDAHYFFGGRYIDSRH